MKNRRYISFGGPWQKQSADADVSYGGVLYIFENPDEFKAQLDGRINALSGSSPEITGKRIPVSALLSYISTDHIITVPHLLTDNTGLLAARALCGLPPDYGVTEGRIASAGASVLVAGPSFGMGSSREQAVTSLLAAGITAIIAPSFGPIFEKNAAYLGLLTSVDMSLPQLIDTGQPVPLEAFLKGKSNHLKDVVSAGGLFPYLEHPARQRRRKTGGGKNPALNIWEKRLLSLTGRIPVPGDTLTVPVHAAYSYVGLSGPAKAALIRHRRDLITLDRKRIFLFEDHFAYSGKPEIAGLTANQRAFAKELGLPAENYFFGRLGEGGGAGICHRVMLENLNPAEVRMVIATDSHTPTLGALPLTAVPVGSTLFAAALACGQIPLSVSSVTRIQLTGTLPEGVTIRDAQLSMAKDITAKPGASVIEFGGSGLMSLSFEAVAALCNMVPETFLGDAAVTENFPAGAAYLGDRYGISGEESRTLYGMPDPDARYAQVYGFDLSATVPWISLPGNPKDSRPLSGLPAYPRINRSFIASCTNGVREIYEAACILKGRKVAAGVLFLVIPSSRRVYEAAKGLGYVEILSACGARVQEESACSICIGDGPEAVTDGDIAVSATNRNFPGRMGHPRASVYLAGAIVTAMSAVLGRIPNAREYHAEMKRAAVNFAALPPPVSAV
ncbi:hypothetical protein A2Z33_06615 [Candidatus Gottesmanbacteria bacterium RBG_16_52_11]|uniref:Uncharacterized protein n=1 Tax=Candidatus Gottesmanbacteria bacterium RBG_16_52_11 TaxID=1798374 RepID=A0A1F5YXK9_9BACT|nr:MAG: hypothetical protein A2Z33_06615 [Candidatus Gottesmanbacteria bacterium RBG_16_52_11]